MKTLLSADLWITLSKTAEGHKRTHAAISYVTANYLDSREGDVLACDASDDAIKSVMASA